MCVGRDQDGKKGTMNARDRAQAGTRLDHLICLVYQRTAEKTKRDPERTARLLKKLTALLNKSD